MSQEPIRVLLVDDIAETRENMKKLLLFEDDIQVVGDAESGEKGIELAREIRPDVVIMDINMPGIDGITAAERLTREVPGIQIIMMSVQSEADYLRRSMLAGAREFLIKPPSAEEIVTSIRRVHGLSPAPVAAPPPVAVVPVAPPVVESPPPSISSGKGSRPGTVYAVMGTKGGVGTSSIASNLAVALQELEPSATVAIVDANTEFGVLSVLFNLNAERSIVDLVNVDEIDTSFVADVLIPHASGVKVLPGSAPTEAELVNNEKMAKVISALRSVFDYVVLDTRPTFHEPILTVLDAADTVLLVTTADIPSIRNARVILEVVDQLEYPKQKMKLVLNRYNPQGVVTKQAIQASIKHPILAALPFDDRTADTAIQHGLPYVLGSPRSPLAGATLNLAKALVGSAESQQVALPQRAQVADDDDAAKRSLFSKLFGR